MSGTCSASGIPSPGALTRVLQGWALSRVEACRSAILICLRMNDRSPAVTVKPAPTGPTTACAVDANPVTVAIDIAKATPIPRNRFDLCTAASKDFERTQPQHVHPDLERNHRPAQNSR